MRTRDSLTDRITATFDRPLVLASTVADVAHRRGQDEEPPAEEGSTHRRVRSGQELLGRGGSAARTAARKRARVLRKEAKRQRRRFFKRRRHIQSIAAERVDGLKAGAAAAGTAAAEAAASRASDAASAGADQARTLAGEARSWLAEQAAGIDVGGAVAALAPTALSKPRRKRRRPLTTIGLGAVAGLVGMAAMDAAQRGFAQVAPETGGEGGGGGGESGRDPWQDASSPAKIGKRIWEGVLRQPTLGPDKIGIATNVMHVGYGITLAAVFALIEESRDDPSPIVDGALFGLAAWAFEEYLLPRVDVSPPARTLSASEHAQDLAYHLAYGLGAGATIAAADARR